VYTIDIAKFPAPDSDPGQVWRRILAITPREERHMDSAIGFLTFGTLGFVLAFAYISARAAEKQLNDTRARKALERDAGAKAVPARG
jgi:hypothetical protein